jgi:hypothetical protein
VALLDVTTARVTPKFTTLSVGRVWKFVPVMTTVVPGAPLAAATPDVGENPVIVGDPHGPPNGAGLVRV